MCSYKIFVPYRNVWQSDSWWYAYYIERQCPSIQRSEKLATKFKRGRNSVEDKHNSGRSKDAASTENFQIVNDTLKEDRRLTIWHIVETKDIHATTVYWTVSDDLGTKKVSARWVPRMLMDEQKQKPVDVCTDLLCRLQAQPQIFHDRIVTRDETWVHHFDSETKWQNIMVWKHASYPTPKKFKAPHLLEVMATVFETVKVW